MKLENQFTKDARIEVPVICGAMYPCSNPELVAAVSEAGGIGIIQPLSMVFVHRHEFRAGMKLIQSLTSKPVGMNVITEKSSKIYRQRMEDWLKIALEEGVRFFVTSLGDPKWVVDAVAPYGGVVYHDVTERKWAEKALSRGARGLICVNNRAGGHAGNLSSQELFNSMRDLGVPLICAGGVGDGGDFREALEMGYLGVQLGTRFIATEECRAHNDYKQAILKAEEKDIVLTDKISGVPVAVIKTPYIERVGTKANFLARMMLRHHKMKHWMRSFYTLQAVWKLKRASLEGSGYKDYFQAGKSVRGVKSIKKAGDVVREFKETIIPTAT